MVLDSSAILAILFEQDGHGILEQKIGTAPLVFVGAPTMLETAMVLTGSDQVDILPRLMGLLHVLDVEIVPFAPEHFQIALDAFRRFGKGRHPAGLNFGDCMSYAVASLSGLPLLYIGQDFSKTDIEAA
jgi:ribonuclease VapC